MRARLSLRKYILIGQTPVPEPDLMKWARWFGTADRVVSQTYLGKTLISTVFLGMEPHTPPRLFETMVFGEDGEAQYRRRCFTWLQAEAQHRRIVAVWRRRLQVS